ncbi:MAG TPA: sugar ABC transporter substrate-binding protein [Candidatus Aminicenantes bacterium]|nr:MAG: sugar ABC transporter substrate-binding protein [Candidatus Aminicenantes bacterium]HEK85907.1 sugar ABC transporter substrate-binding protein [Candidatus Aminicenantes bacterium]
MKKELRVIFFLACLIVFLALIGCRSDRSSKASKGTGGLKKTYQIAVIPKGTTHEYWKAVEAGAIQAAQELGVEIFWKGPQKEDDRSQQIQVLEDFISRQVDGIVLAPLDDRALVRPVDEARAEGIPVVIIDSNLQGENYLSFIATDNYKGGVMAARRLAEVMGGKGKIFLIRYLEGSASTTFREQGFLDTVTKEYPGLELLVKDQYAGTTTESAYQLTENLLSRYPQVEGIFAPNESSTFGALRALQEAGLAGKIKFVGFDSSAKLIQALKDKELDGLVLQDPVKMGYLGVKTLVDYLQGKPVEKRIDTGVTLATPENMNQPEIKSLLEPDISKYVR